MNCVLHYFQMSEAVRPIIWAFSPTFCHLSPILGPRGHVKIESDSQTSMLNRLIGLSCHGPDQSSLTPGQSEVFQSKPPDPDSGQPLKKGKKQYQYANCSREKSHWRIGKCLFSLKKKKKVRKLSLGKNQTSEFTERLFCQAPGLCSHFHFQPTFRGLFLWSPEWKCLFANDLMSTQRCHMKDFFSHFILSIPPSIYILFHMQHCMKLRRNQSAHRHPFRW